MVYVISIPILGNGDVSFYIYHDRKLYRPDHRLVVWAVCGHTQSTPPDLMADRVDLLDNGRVVSQHSTRPGTATTTTQVLRMVTLFFSDLADGNIRRGVGLLATRVVYHIVYHALASRYSALASREIKQLALGKNHFGIWNCRHSYRDPTSPNPPAIYIDRWQSSIS